MFQYKPTFYDFITQKPFFCILISGLRPPQVSNSVLFIFLFQLLTAACKVTHLHILLNVRSQLLSFNGAVNVL